MNVIPFQPQHFERLDLQASQAVALSHVTPAYTRALAECGPALTVMHGERVLGCGGMAVMPFGVGCLWAFLAGDSGPHFVGIHRVVSRFLEAIPMRRVETSVLAGFQPGCRWMDMLGFQFEGVMRAYGPDGADYLRYARVK